MIVMGKVKIAEDAARKIIEIDPSHADPHINLGNSLKDQGRIEEAIDSYNNALKIQPDNTIARSNMLLCLNYSDIDPGTLFEEHKKWDESVRQKIVPLNYSDRRIEPDKTPLRVGYVSAYFKTHSIAYYLETILEHHDRSQFEIFCYADIPNPDPVTVRIKKLPVTWRPIHEKTDGLVADLIIKDKIDILVDLAGHAGNKRLPLFLNKLAPVQITYIGYPNTTGLSTMDYRLTDGLADPGSQDRYYTEKLYRLPGCFLCYKPPITTPPVAEPPAIKNGYITFGSFNNLPKISSGTIHAWTHILKAVPHSKLMIKTKPFNDNDTIKRYENFFINKGIERSRLLFKGYSSSLDKHLQSYNEIDIGLDTFPYNGTTTTCEALWMGVPVVTLAGEKHAGRVGVSLLMCIGLSGMVAENSERYIALASFMASDVQQLSKLRKSLRSAIAQSPLCDGKTFTRKLEDAYGDMWHRKAKAEK